MAEISVDVPDDVALLVDRLEPDEIRRIVSSALRERASEALMYDVADELLAESELDDETARELADVVKERVATRHRNEPVS